MPRKEHGGIFRLSRTPAELVQEVAANSGVGFEDTRKVIQALSRLFILTMAVRGVFTIQGVGRSRLVSKRFTKTKGGFHPKNPEKLSERDRQVISTKIEVNFHSKIEKRIVSLIIKLSEKK